jgi:Right handed beta helix region
MPRSRRLSEPRRSRRWVGAVATALVVGAACSGALHGSGTERAARRAVLVSQTVVPVPATIDYTGKSDVTDALQSFIDGLDDGVLVRFHRNGRYRVEGTLFVTNKTLTFDGQGATIFATTPGTLERSQWWITGGEDIIFRNIKVDGANPYAGVSDRAYDPKKEKQHGFRIEGVDGIELDHVTVTDTYGDFVYVARFVQDTNTNVWIHDSTFARNGRQGIALVAATGVIIERNTFTDTRRATIDLEPNGPGQLVSQVFVLNNTIGRGRLLFIASHGQGPVNDVVISGNQLHNHIMSTDVMAPKGQRRKNWIFRNNTSDTVSYNRPIRFISVDGVRVTGNKQPISGPAEGVTLMYVCGGKVVNNTFGKGPQVKRIGPTCSATLVEPTEPAIKGRT